MNTVFFTDTLKCSCCGEKRVDGFKLVDNEYICTICLKNKNKEKALKD